MTTIAAQGDLALLDDPVSQALLASTQTAHLAYIWLDGTPRSVPLCFNWTGSELVFGTPPKAPKVRALRRHPDVAVTIDDASAWPFRVLMIRGSAQVDLHDDIVPEYAAAVRRYLGDEAGGAWLGQLAGKPMVRVAVVPRWVAVLDHETRFQSALAG